MKKSYILLLSLICIELSQAQNIKRKGALGVSLYTPISDSLTKALRLKTNKGALLKAIFPASTAQALKLEPYDLVTAINNVPILNAADLIKQARQLREGQPIKVNLIRNEQAMQLNAYVIAKPYDQHPDMEIIYGEFAYDKGFVRSIYRKPKNKKPLGTVYFVQGISCYSLDNMQPKDPTRLATEALVNRGYAVYCVEKPGMGDNYNTCPCEEAGFNLELSIFKAGYKNLLQQQEIDTTQIFIFGHSLGGFSAPLIAQAFQPKGVIIYGAGLKPWSEYLVDVFTIQEQIMGKDLATLRQNIENLKPSFYDFFYGQTPLDKFLKNKKNLNVMQQLMEYNPTTKRALAGRSLPFHQEINQHNSAMAWRNTKSYVLTIYGEADIAAIYPDDHIAIANYVNEVHPGKGTYLFVPKTNHTFQEIGTMAEYVQMQSNPLAYETMAQERFNYKLFDDVCNWMADKLTKTL